MRTSQLSGYMQQFAAGLQPSMQNAALQAMEPILPQIDARLGNLEKDAQAAVRRFGEVDKRCDGFANDIKELKASLAVREANPFARQVPEQVDPNSFDSTLVRITSQAPVGIDGIRGLVKDLLGRISCNDTHANVSGPGLGTSELALPWTMPGVATFLFLYWS